MCDLMIHQVMKCIIIIVLLQFTLQNRATDEDVYEVFNLDPVLTSSVRITGLSTYQSNQENGFSEVQLIVDVRKYVCVIILQMNKKVNVCGLKTYDGPHMNDYAHLT